MSALVDLALRIMKARSRPKRWFVRIDRYLEVEREANEWALKYRGHYVLYAPSGGLLVAGVEVFPRPHAHH